MNRKSLPLAVVVAALAAGGAVGTIPTAQAQHGPRPAPAGLTGSAVPGPRVTARAARASQGQAGLAAALAATPGIGVDPAVEKQVLEAWGGVWDATQPPPMGFTGNIANCQAGTTSAAYRQAELSTVNALRALAGADPASENVTWSALAQQAALMMTAEGALSHYPDPSWACYSQAGADSAGAANLFLGWVGPAAMVGYVADPGANNTFVGHRRWLLCPENGDYGFGDAGDANATQVFDPYSASSSGSGLTRDGYVAWPNRGYVPVPLADDWGLLDRFSVMVGPDESVASASVSISSSNGVPVSPTQLALDDLAYCSPSAVWRPSRAPAAGETWTVTVANVRDTVANTSRTISYPIVFTGSTFDTPFVAAAYEDFLGRTAGRSELDFQSQALWNGLATTNGFLRGMANSSEWVSAIVRKMYLDTLGREPDPAGLATWVSWIVSKRFTVAQAASQFYSSPEFFAGIGGNTLQSWVTQLYEKLLYRAPDPAGLAFWVARAGNPSIGRTSVAYDFYQSTESRMTRVKNLYQVLLKRDPDPTGWPFWAEIIKTSGDIELAVSLADSEEYANKAWDRYTG